MVESGEARPIPFLRAIFSEWGSGVTGGLSAPLFVWALVASGTPRVASGILAVVCFYVAAYRVWKRERMALHAEQHKNSMPEIRGELFDFAPGMQGRGHEYGIWSSRTRVRFSVAVCNHRDVPTNIDRLVVDGMGTRPPCSITNIVVSVPGKSFDEPAFLPTDVVLQRGIQTYMTGTADIEINIDQSAAPVTLDLTKLRPSVVDGFGNLHSLGVRAGEVVEFSDAH